MKLIEEWVKAGKLTPQQVELAEKSTGPTVLKLVGGAGAVIGSFWSVLWWGFIFMAFGQEIP